MDRNLRLTLNPLPENYDEHAGWRFQLKAALLGLGVDPLPIMIYLDEMDKKDFDELPRGQPEELVALDAKLFSAVCQATKGKAHVRHIQAIESSVIFGCGRQAVRILDKAHRYEITKLAAKASSGVVKQKCSTMPQLLEYLPLMKHRLYQLKLAGTPMPGSIGRQQSG